MNHMPRFQIAPDKLDAEHAVIATCLIDPARIADAESRISHTDFEHPFLSRCFRVMSQLRRDGRRSSVESLIEEIGNDEIEPRLTVRQFLTAAVQHALRDEFGSVDDAVSVILDRSQRRQLMAIAGNLNAAAAGNISLSDIIADATGSLDEIKSELSRDRRRSYDARGAAEAVFEHLDASGTANPTTGIKALDDMLGGWPRGELSVVAGRPGMGKSAFATTALLRAGKARHGSLFFSLEMTAKQLGSRMLADVSYTRDRPIMYQDIFRRDLKDMDRDRLRRAQEIMAAFPIRIEEQRGLSIADIAARSRKIADDYERDGGALDVVFVDHMLLVKPSSRYHGNRVREVAEISDGLASLAKELNVAVVALCQLNRGVEGREEKRPMLSDLRDSGAIEEDASSVTFIYRPAYYMERKKAETIEAQQALDDALNAKRNSLEFIVAKNRNGAVGLVEAFVEIGANAVRDKV